MITSRVNIAQRSEYLLVVDLSMQGPKASDSRDGLRLMKQRPPVKNPASVAFKVLTRRICASNQLKS